VDKVQNTSREILLVDKILNPYINLSDRTVVLRLVPI